MKNIKHFYKALIAVILIVAVQSCGLVNNEAETTLVITVRDFNSGQLIQGGQVTIYESLNDWTYSNGYRVTNTDANGQATFTGIKSGIDYYFDAEQGGKNNSTSNIHVGSAVKPRQTTYVSTYIQ